MCGIFCTILRKSNTNESNNSLEIEKPLCNLLQRRGPNAAAQLKLQINHIELLFGGFVLWQQGAEICQQPMEKEHIILLFNGDVYKAPKLELETEADTAWLGGALAACENEEQICKVLRTLEGPYSLMWYDKRTHCLYVCRDSLGRNSLIVEKSEQMWRFMSTGYFACNSESEVKVRELLPLGLFQMDVQNMQNWTLFPWQQLHEDAVEQLRQFEKDFELQVKCEECIAPQWLKLESTTEPSFNFYKDFDITLLPMENLFDFLIQHEKLQNALNVFSWLLENSVQQRVQKTPDFCTICLPSRAECHHAKISILFSGGIDCSILALVAHKYVKPNEPIELLNVAFEKANTKGTDSWNVPDRITAQTSLKELHRLCPTRNWEYTEINVTRQELKSELNTHIKHLIYPLNTILDESIGCAFWFAARGKVTLNNSTHESTARIVLVGSGADELFGGYTRHRNAFKRCLGNEEQKLDALRAELEHDWRRIPMRNLARDDRVVADSGRTLRAPFIEERLVQFVRSLKADQRCCFLLPEGVGDKLFLRLFGYRLGLATAALHKKRAIQFGSRIANSKQNAAEVSEYLKRKLSIE